MLGGHGGGADDDLGAVGPQQGDLLLAHLVGHHEDAAVATPGRHYGQAHPRVPRRRLHDGPALAELTRGLGPGHHGQGRTVLHAAPGVELLQLAQEVAGELAPDAVEAHQRGVPHQVEQ